MSEPARALDTELHAVVFSGRLLPGQDTAVVRARLQAALRMSEAQAGRLFAGQPVTVRRGLSWAEAMKYQTVFRKLGAVLTIHPDSGPRPTPATPPAPQAAPVAPALIKAAAPAPAPVKPAATPEPAPGPVATKPVARKVKAAAAVVHRIDPEPISLAQQLRLNLTAAVMLVLPLMYLGAIALIGRALLAQLGSGMTLFAEYNPLLAIPMFVLPLLALLGLGLLWLEPIWPSKSADDNSVDLDPTTQAETYAWCGRLCRTLDVPEPTSLRLSLAPASRAELTNGVTSLVHQTLELRLSASQVAGLDARELACIVGHELARFADWRIMKLAYLIDAIHRRFARGLDRESGVSLRLARLARHDDERLARAGRYGQALVDGLRLPLVGLLRLSGFLSRPVLHELCFRADRSAAQLFGPEQYANALVHAAWLQEADQLADTKNWQAWAEGRLVDDRVLLTLRFARQAGEDRATFRDELCGEEASRWARLPTVGQRLEALSLLPAGAGVLSNDPGPQPQLRDFPRLSRELTETHYALHGIEAGEGQRLSASQMLTLTQDQDETQAALERYFHGWHQADRFLPLPALETLMNEEAAQRSQALQDAVDKLRQRMPDIERVQHQFDAARTQVRQLLILRSRLDAGEKGEGMELSRVENALEGALAAYNGRLLDSQSIEALLGQRLAVALSLAMAAGEKHKLEGMPAIFAALRGLHRLQPSLDELAQNEAVVSGIAELPTLRSNPHLARELRLKQTSLREQLASLRQMLAKLPHPLESGNLGDGLNLPVLPPDREPETGELLTLSRGLREQLAYLNRRLTGQLARLAEPYEERYCLRPLKTRLARANA